MPTVASACIRFTYHSQSKCCVGSGDAGSAGMCLLITPARLRVNCCATNSQGPALSGVRRHAELARDPAFSRATWPCMCCCLTGMTRGTSVAQARMRQAHLQSFGGVFRLRASADALRRARRRAQHHRAGLPVPAAGHVRPALAAAPRVHRQRRRALWRAPARSASAGLRRLLARPPFIWASGWRWLCVSRIACEPHCTPQAAPWVRKQSWRLFLACVTWQPRHV